MSKTCFLSMAFIIIAASGCSKSDIDKCAEAQIESCKEDPKRSMYCGDTEAQTKATAYKLCLRIAGRGNQD